MTTQPPTSPQDQFHLSPEQQEIFNRAMLILIGVGIGWFIFADKEGYATNIFTEILGVAGTFFVLEYWVQRRDERQRVEELKSRLLVEARSTSNEIAKHAIHQIRENGWLLRDTEEQILSGSDLSEANLQGVDFEYAELERAYLFAAKLNGARLADANMRGVSLEEAAIVGADMFGVDLQGANLSEANLQDVKLTEAKLQGAYLGGVNLQGARLHGTRFDENTTLPDGTYWEPETDMSRFTNPDHADFWQPDWIKRQAK